jgi:Protein of unknown function (DUF3485)
MHRTILTVSAALLLVASGAVHGIWTERWTSDPEDLRIAAERLLEVPASLGKWDGKNVDMPADPKSGLAGVVARRFVHRENGKVITVYLACGRPGPTCIHTPDACYQAAGYNEAESPRRKSVPGDGKTPSEFWSARYVRTQADGQANLRLFWSWHTAEGWKVADNPRIAFAGESVLHKLYVIREMANPNDPAEAEVCAEFMRELLPVLEQKLFVK